MNSIIIDNENVLLRCKWPTCDPGQGWRSCAFVVRELCAIRKQRTHPMHWTLRNFTSKLRSFLLRSIFYAFRLALRLALISDDFRTLQIFGYSIICWMIWEIDILSNTKKIHVICRDSRVLFMDFQVISCKFVTSHSLLVPFQYIFNCCVTFSVKHHPSSSPLGDKSSHYSATKLQNYKTTKPHTETMQQILAQKHPAKIRHSGHGHLAFVRVLLHCVHKWTNQKWACIVEHSNNKMHSYGKLVIPRRSPFSTPPSS